MASLTIYHGAARPMVARGTHQVRMLGFAERFRGWHSVGRDRASKRAAAQLAALGYIELTPSGEYRFTYPKG